MGLPAWARWLKGWFPPRRGGIHLRHSARAEAVDSPAVAASILDGLRFLELRKRPLVNQHHQMVDPPTIKSEGEKQARI